MSLRQLLHLTLAILAFAASSISYAIGDVALITAAQGKIERLASSGTVPVEAFVKLKEGDRLSLAKDSLVRIVYFDNGRQETWRGEGKLEIKTGESLASGLPPAEVKTLPALVVKQIAKTPALDSQGRAGVTRLRAVGPPDALSKLEAEYDRMRVEGGGKDLNAEIYLLSGLFELRELERVENLINDLGTRQKGNTEAMLLVSLYRKALSEIKQKR